ncbi:MAG: phage tail family protein [Coriobacteriaceae bacterium]|nr:phage tail family protein [Coriobacteriaceae bacterium]
MGYLPFSVTVGGVPIEGQTHGLTPDGLYVDWDTGIQGWFETPQAKVLLSERASGDGAFPVTDGSVLYSARTVTVGVMAAGPDSDAVAAHRRRLLALAHRIVRLVVRDGLEETQADGYVEVAWGKVRRTRAQTGTLTVVCPDPRRYGTTPHRAYLVPGTGGGGLEWSEPDPHGLVWPVSFADTGGGQNVATIWNGGTSTAYPIITASGSIDWLTITDVEGGGQLSYQEHVGWTPLVLDCLSRTATVSGVDRSRLLTHRDFPSIPAGGSVTLALTGTGTGTVAVECRDTYI